MKNKSPFRTRKTFGKRRRCCSLFFSTTPPPLFANPFCSPGFFSIPFNSSPPATDFHFSPSPQMTAKLVLPRNENSIVKHFWPYTHTIPFTSFKGGGVKPPRTLRQNRHIFRNCRKLRDCLWSPRKRISFFRDLPIAAISSPPPFSRRDATEAKKGPFLGHLTRVGRAGPRKREGGKRRVGRGQATMQQALINRQKAQIITPGA